MPTSCCNAPEYHDVARALGWLQCRNCGRFLAHDEAEIDFAPALLVRLRESWHMRQEGGGVTRKQWAALTAAGKVVSYAEAQDLHHARQSAERYIELEPEATIHIFEIHANGLCGLHETVDPRPWCRPATPGRRQRLSPLAARQTTQRAARVLAVA